MASMDAYDNLLTYIGGFGRYQKRILLLVGIACAGQSIHMLNTIFTMGYQDFRCAIPEMPNDTFLVQNKHHTERINNSVPFDRTSNTYSQCYTYPMNSNVSNINSNFTSEVELEKCTRWVFDDSVYSTTVVSEFMLVCDGSIYTSHANMLTLLGMMVGSLVGGAVSDRFGRRKAFVLMTLVQFLSALALVFVPSIPMFLTMRVLVCASGLASFSTACVLCMELVSPSRRTVAGLVTMFGWVAGLVVLTAAAFFIREWRLLQLVLTCPLLVITVIYFLILPESPRWLLSNGRDSEAKTIFTKMARVNGKELPEKTLLADVNNHGATGSINSEEDNGSKGGDKGLMLLLKSRILVPRLLVLAFGWLVNSMVYYGLTLNVGSIIEGSIYLNVFIMSVLEFLAYLMCIVCLDTIEAGRRVLFCACIAIGGVACLGTMVPLLVEGSPSWINAVLSNIGRFCITASFCIVWIYTAEQLPTSVRQSGIGFCSFIGRVGGMVSPYIGALPEFVSGPIGRALPLVIFGIAAVLSGAAAIFLPETANRNLPDTVEDAEAMSWRERTKKKQTRGS